MWERWDKDSNKKPPEDFYPGNVVGIVHNPKKASKRMYNRMYRRALRISKKEGRKLVKDIKVNLEGLAKLKTESSV